MKVVRTFLVTLAEEKPINTVHDKPAQPGGTNIVWCACQVGAKEEVSQPVLNIKKYRTHKVRYNTTDSKSIDFFTCFGAFLTYDVKNLFELDPT